MAVSMLILAGCGNSAAGTGASGSSASGTSAVSAGSPESQKTGEESYGAGTEQRAQRIQGKGGAHQCGLRTGQPGSVDVRSHRYGSHLYECF